jgi:hypothetical protein
MRKRLALLVVMAIVVKFACAQESPPAQFGLRNATFVVKLLSRLSTKNAEERYTFTALVEEPVEYHGAVVEGRVTKVKMPRNETGEGGANLQFRFENLTFNHRTARIEADLTDVRNSRGAKGVDDEGQVIGKTTDKKRITATAEGAALGALIGWLRGGTAGAAIGAAAGAVAGLVIGLKMTITASDVDFEPGSLFTLSVSDEPRVLPPIHNTYLPFLTIPFHAAMPPGHSISGSLSRPSNCCALVCCTNPNESSGMIWVWRLVGRRRSDWGEPKRVFEFATESANLPTGPSTRWKRHITLT